MRRDEPAIIFEGRTITHGEFAGRSFQLARALQRLGLGVGDRLAILAQNCPEYMEVYAAGELGGWTTVTINYRLAEPGGRLHPGGQQAEGRSSAKPRCSIA